MEHGKKNKCRQQLTCDLGNKCLAADLKLQKQWWLVSAPGGIKRDIWYYRNRQYFCEYFPQIDKHILTNMSQKSLYNSNAERIITESATFIFALDENIVFQSEACSLFYMASFLC